MKPYPNAKASMSRTFRPGWALCLLVLVLGLPALGDSLSGTPEFLSPGANYLEYPVNHRTGNSWRVTDPLVERADARIFLPNNEFTIQDVDINSVTHAEIMLSHWLGHGGTFGQVVHFNDAPPIGISLETPYSALYRAYPLNMDNPILPLPLEYLKEGNNTYQGSIAQNLQGQHWWSQWGWYALYLRTYLPAETSQTTVAITNMQNGDVIQDNPELIIKASNPDGIQKIEVFAKYYGYDENGDYVFDDWHYFFLNNQGPEGHAGTIRLTDTKTNFHSLTWNTEWIPDQEPGAVSLVVRVQDMQGIYTVSEAVTGLTLERPDSSVKLFLSGDVPLVLIRANTTRNIFIRIPNDYPLEQATAARMPIRTWNGANNEIQYTPLTINGSQELKIIRGANHYYKLESPNVDPDLLMRGNNILNLSSSTVHHGCEVLLPGPAFLVKWDRALPRYVDGSRTPSKSGWYDGWFGSFYYTYKSRWVYSQKLGWLYWNPPRNPDLRHGWFYSPELDWVFLNEDLLPLIYYFQLEEWGQLQSLWKP